MLRYLALFILVFFLILLFWVLYKKFNPKEERTSYVPKQRNSLLWVCLVCIECTILYAALATAISTAWFKGDDYIFFRFCDGSILDRLMIICGRYTTCNGRLGDIIATLIGISENRWQHIFLTPVFIIATPFALHRLMATEDRSIFSPRGALFILLVIALYTISVSLTPMWRNFWCYAAAVNYIWPIPVLCLFLSLFRSGLPIIKNKLWATIVGMGLGIYSAWSLECITLFLMPGLCLWVVYQFLKKRHIPHQCAGGITGALLGAFLLTGTPALSRRAAAELASRTFDPSQYDWQQMLEFVTNQTPSNLELLQGDTVSYLLDGIPLPLHLFYIPLLLKHFLDCCLAPLIVFAILAVLHILQRGRDGQHTIRNATLLVIFAFVVACSYLISCIPSKMSFLPPSFIILAACSYLFLRLSGKKVLAGGITLTLSIVCLSIYLIAPSVTEATNYKKYERMRLKIIHQQLAEGKRHIILPPKYPSSPEDKLGLINAMDLGERPTAYPNFIAAKCYGVDSIIQLPYKKK